MTKEHSIELKQAIATAQDLQEFVAIIADVEQDEEYRIITAFVDDIEEFCDDMEQHVRTATSSN